MKFIEKPNEGYHLYNRFSADFTDNTVRLNNLDYPLGTISLMVTNISADDMTELLLLGGKVKFCYEAIHFYGYSRKRYSAQQESILEMLECMKKHEVFGFFDFEESKKLIESVYSADALDRYDEILEMEPPFSDEQKYRIEEIKKLFEYAKVLGAVYAYIAIDTANFATAVQNYTKMLMEKSSRQKSELAKTAFELFNDELFMYYLYQSNPAENTMRGFSVNSVQTVAPVIDNKDGDYKILRRIYFSRMMDFYVMDLFEALSHCHYLWQCKICERYFLMTSAHKQLYCDDVNPEYNVPCKYIAKHPEITKQKMESQKKTATPNYLLWKRRDNFIRKRKSRGKYSESEFASAKIYINDCYDKSQLDFEYAKNKYEDDMEIKVIDREVRKATDV